MSERTRINFIWKRKQVSDSDAYVPTLGQYGEGRPGPEQGQHARRKHSKNESLAQGTQSRCPQRNKAKRHQKQ